MARGQKYDEELKEKVYAMLASGDSYASVARKTGIPAGTVRGWRKYISNTEKEEKFAEVRAYHKEMFVKRAWRSIGLAQTLLERRLERAAEQEAQIDALLLTAEQAARDGGLSETASNALLKKIDALRCDDVGKIASLLGTLYDKQALANREATEIVGGQVTLKKFEDY